MKKAGVLMAAVALLVVVSGCEKKVEKKGSIAKSEEFFKEIEAPVTVIANADVQTLQTANREIQTGTTQAQAESQTIPLEAQINVPQKPTIQDIQQALANTNLYKGKIDGVMGPKTKQAIREFQTQNNLKADGKVGPATWAQLKVHYQKTVEMTAVQPTTLTTPNTNTHQNGD